MKNKNGKGAECLKKNSSGRLKVIQLDITNQNEVDNAIEYIKENLPDKEKGTLNSADGIVNLNKILIGLWGIVNNAGASAFGEIEWSPMELYQSVSEVNLFGLIRITKACLPLIRK